MADARSRPCNLAPRPSPVNGRAALVITADGIYPGVFGRLARPAPWCVVTGDAAHGGADRTGDGERAGLRLWACLVVAWDGHGTGDAEGSLRTSTFPLARRPCFAVIVGFVAAACRVYTTAI
jgi:hypothetical protein